MADLITSHRSSDKLAKFTGFNLFNKDALFGVEQTSEESTSSNNENSSSRDGGAGEDSSIFKTCISKPKQKKVISVSSISRLSIPQSHKPIVNLTKTKVKISALLYEITERTNRLAQPRSRVTETEASQKSLKCGISKPISRIFELACPKVIHDSPTKPINLISPSGLKAIAMQRIIELSQPRKDRHFKSPTHKMQIHQSYNSRFRDFFMSKEMNHTVKAKRFDLSGKDNNQIDKRSEMMKSIQVLQGLLR